MKTKLTALVLTLTMILSSGINVLAADIDTQHSLNGVTMSYEEIMHDINERLGSSLEPVPTTRRGELSASEVFFSGQALLDEIEFLEDFAIRVLEANAIAERLWYERTGLTLEEVEEIPIVQDDNLSSDGYQPIAPFYMSWRTAWSPNSWITAMAEANVNVNSSPRTFASIRNVTASGRRLNGLDTEEYRSTSYRAAIIDSGRTATANISGTVHIMRPFPLPGAQQALTVYTEFYAATP